MHVKFRMNRKPDMVNTHNPLSKNLLNVMKKGYGVFLENNQNILSIASLTMNSFSSTYVGHFFA